jgi:hypothetical protein
MNRETILKHSKSIRLNNQILQDFTDVVAEYCTIKGHPEHLSAIIQLLQQPMVGEQIIDEILEYFEKEYKIIKLEKLNITNTAFGNIENKQLINIY